MTLLPSALANATTVAIARYETNPPDGLSLVVFYSKFAEPPRRDVRRTTLLGSRVDKLPTILAVRAALLLPDQPFSLLDARWLAPDRQAGLCSPPPADPHPRGPPRLGGHAPPTRPRRPGPRARARRRRPRAGRTGRARPTARPTS